MEVPQQTGSSKCEHCNSPLPFDHLGPCPKCGQTGKIMHKQLNENIHTTDSVEYTSIREYYEKNQKAKWAVVFITVISSLIGMFLSGAIGVLAGLILGAISYFVGPKAIMKVREITHG